MKKITQATLALSFLSTPLYGAAVQVSAVSTVNAILDNTGTALSSGVGTVNGDGALFEIGYFTVDTASFDGGWVAITGSRSNNPTLVTTIGDLAAQDGMTNVPDGLFSTDSFFDTESVQSTTGDLPPGDAQLAVRFYNNTDPLATMFNTATSSEWKFLSPSNPTAGPVVLDFNNNAITINWEDAANPFRTTIAVPEPSSTALLGLGGLALIIRRRR